jgi:hypothetical protein
LRTSQAFGPQDDKIFVFSSLPSLVSLTLVFSRKHTVKTCALHLYVPSSQLRLEHSHPHPQPPRHYIDWGRFHVLARYCNSSVAQRGLRISGDQLGLVFDEISLQGRHRGRGVYADQIHSLRIYGVQRLLKLLLLSSRLLISFCTTRARQLTWIIDLIVVIW